MRYTYAIKVTNISTGKPVNYVSIPAGSNIQSYYVYIYQNGESASFSMPAFTICASIYGPDQDNYVQIDGGGFYGLNACENIGNGYTTDNPARVQLDIESGATAGHNFVVWITVVPQTPQPDIGQGTGLIGVIQT